MNATIEKKPVGSITAEKIQSQLKKFNWEAHWDRVIEKVSRQAEAFEKARAASRSQAARKVFV